MNPINLHSASETQRMAFLPRLFGQGILAVKGEMQTSYALARLCPQYDGSDWCFYQLSNGGGYLAPAVSVKRLTLNCPGRQMTVEVTPDAAGIIVTMFALSYLSNDPDHSVEQLEHLMESFQQLRQFASHHAEASLITHFFTQPQPEQVIDQGSKEEEIPLIQAYVTGLGWCWMHDGEVIEVISDQEDN